MTALDRRALGAAYLWVAKRFPYLTTAVVSVRVVAAPGLGGSAVDESWRLYVDPDVAASWSVADLGAMLVHHTGHLLRDHAGRAKAIGITQSNAKRWSDSCDAELNDDLAEVGVTPPGDALLPEALGGDRGRPAEEYFGLEQVEVDDDSGSGADADDHGSGVHGVPRPWDEPPSDDQQQGMTPHEADLIRGRVADDVLAAARDGMGTVPSGLLRWAGDLLDPKVNWRKALAAEIRRGVAKASGRVDYSYRKPSRRAPASPDVVLPSMEQPVPEVAVVCDTSGSMGDDELARVLVEVEGLLRAIGVRSQGVHVLAVDAAVHTVSRVTTARGLSLAGGGGTDMRAGIDAAAALRPKPSVIVVLTDGFTPWPAEPPRGMSVVVGLIGASAARVASADRVPAWARVVVVDDAA